MIEQEVIFTKEECDTIISYSKIYTESIHYHTNVYGDNITTIDTDNKLVNLNGHYSYNLYVIPNNTHTNWIFNKLQKWFSSRTNIEFKQDVKKFTLHRYSIGDEFKKHIDATINFKDRRYNIGVQLNDDYVGGEYICWDKINLPIKILNHIGNASVYHASVPHQINKIINGNRWSLVMPIGINEIIEPNINII
jgi:hypothetical protein